MAKVEVQQILLEYKNMEKYSSCDMESLKKLMEEVGLQVMEMRKLSLKLQKSEECISYYVEGVDSQTNQEVEIIIRQRGKSQMLSLSISYEGPSIRQEWKDSLELRLNWNNRCMSILSWVEQDKSQILLNDNEFNITNAIDLQYLDRIQSDYQDIQVFDSVSFGKVMLIDGQIQISGDLDDNYTVDLSGLVVEGDKHYQHILIIGAGDMLIPNHILNNERVDKVTVCELDHCVTDLVRKHFHISSNIDTNISNGRLNLIFQDGSVFVKTQRDLAIQYDGIIIDNSDVDYINSPAAVLFTQDFFQDIYSLLKPGASFSQQTSNIQVNQIWNQRVSQSGFSILTTFNSYTPEYSIDLPLGKATK